MTRRFEKFQSLPSRERVQFLTKVFDLDPGVASPAAELSLVSGTDPDGWPVWTPFRVGDLVQDRNGSLVCRIGGFTLDGLILAHPHGLGHDPLVASYTIRPEGLTHFDPEPRGEVWTHVDGLVGLTD